MERLLAPLQLFAFNPPAAFIAAVIFAFGCFFRVYSRRARVTLGVMAIIWGGYGIWESYMTSWRSPTGDMAIRADLILFGPLLLITALVGLFILALGWRSKTKE